MQRHYSEELTRLRELILRMGGLAEQMAHQAVQALSDRDPNLPANIREMERQVNQLHIDVDELSVETIALRQPTAADLRFVTAAIRINTDLERIGDQAVNIIEIAERLSAVPPLKPLIDIPRMGEISGQMLKNALDAFVAGNVDLAIETIRRDDEVDRLKEQVFRELLVFMMGDTSTIPRALDLILASRHIERIADHATNICEDVIFMVKGKDIRHGGGFVG